MPSRLDTLREVHATAVQMSVFHSVDDDLAAEAGMDGNYQRLLQAARNLDAAGTTPTPSSGAVNQIEQVLHVLPFIVAVLEGARKDETASTLRACITQLRIASRTLTAE